MKQLTKTLRFLRSESGAVTVDWIVLSSVLIGTGVAIVSMIGGGTQSLTSRINQQLATAQSADTGDGSGLQTYTRGN